jgi:hypothetical protein
MLQSPEKKRPLIQNRGQNPMRPPAERFLLEAGATIVVFLCS